MKYLYTVKFNGKYYKAGEEVPVKEEKEKPVEKKAEEKKTKE